MSSLQLTVNGDARAVPGPATVRTLLAHLGLDPRMVVVEVNREIIRRARHDEVALHAGDTIELVHFVRGG